MRGPFYEARTPSSFSLHSPARILIVRLSHLGDVVHALPLVHALRTAWPKAELGWAIQPEFAGLVEGALGVRTFHFARRGGLSAWPRLAEELSAWGPDWAVDAQGNTKSAVALACSGAIRRVAPAPEDRTEPFAGHLASEHAARARGRHALMRTRALVEHLVPAAALRFDPGLDARELARGRALLREHLGRARAPRLLHLSPADDVRSWPAERFAALARALARRGDNVLVLSGPGESELGERLAREVEGVAHWVGQRGLRDLAAVLAAAAERGGRFIACDSGPMHLAAAVGLPVVLLAGPQDPERTGPWPVGAESPHRIARAAVPPACAPCRSRRCEHPRGPVCLGELAPERVLELLGSA